MPLGYSASRFGMAAEPPFGLAREGNQFLRVRLSWIDAPESSQAFGQRFKQHLSDLVFGRDVELHTHGLDRYGRTLAVIFVNGIDANLEQVRKGMAWFYERYLIQAGPAIQASYRQAETEAWGAATRNLERTAPHSPWEYRRAARHPK